MKIDDSILNYKISKHLPKTAPGGNEGVEPNPLPGKQHIEEKGRPEPDTIVNLSAVSKEAQLMRDVISSEPDIRVEKVEALKEMIQSGSYEIDEERVADKIVDAFLDEIF